MTKKELEHFRNLILEKRFGLMKQVETIKNSEMNGSMREQSGDHSAYSYHMADQGTDSIEKEKIFLCAQRDGDALQKIEQALDRIELGTYGKCEICGENIHKERLEVIPDATLCTKCQSQEEQRITSTEVIG